MPGTQHIHRTSGLKSTERNRQHKTTLPIDLIREIVEEEDGLQRYGVWLRRCFADYLSSEGKKLENCFQIPKNWRNKERIEKRDRDICELASMLPAEGTTEKAIQINELVDDYLNGDWRNHYTYDLPFNADEQTKLLFDIVKKGGVLCQRRIEQIINEI